MDFLYWGGVYWLERNFESVYFLREEIVPNEKTALGRSILKPGEICHPVAPCIFIKASSNSKFVVPQLSKSCFRALNTLSEMLPDRMKVLIQNELMLPIHIKKNDGFILY